MKYCLMPLFLVFAYIEYYSIPGICSDSGTVLGKMWFMWLMMALMCSDNYVNLVCKAVRAK